MLNLLYCTFTGADDSTEPIELVKLSKEYPFVEWGILFSDKRAGKNRYPSAEWIKEFINVSGGINKSAHLCGNCLTDYAAGKEELHKLIKPFQRLQLNFNLKDMPSAFINNVISQSSRNKCQTIITQHNADNEYLWKYFLSLRFYRVNYSVLFDSSAGTGKSPKKWPKPFVKYFNYGYAGGLNPKNLEQELSKITDASKNQPFWIDMESGVRTEDVFDLDKVKSCLGIISTFARENRLTVNDLSKDKSADSREKDLFSI